MPHPTFTRLTRLPPASLRSLPQKSCAHVCTELGELNEADAMRFGWSLANANMLYLGLPVLLVVDDEYAWDVSRTWRLTRSAP